MPTVMSGVEPMNQLSRLSLVVPVLPAIGRPSAASRAAVPRVVTPCIMLHDLVDRGRVVERLARIDDLGRGRVAHWPVSQPVQVRGSWR